MMQKPQRIQKLLTKTFLLSMLTIIALFSVVFSVLDYHSQKAATESEMQRTCHAIAEDIDLQIQQMDTVCLNTINSTMVKQYFYQFLLNPDATSHDIISIRNTLANTMTSIKGVDSSIRQVNIYDMSHRGFGCGNYTGPLTTDVTAFPWYEKAVACDGRRYYPGAQTNPLLSNDSGTNQDRYYFTLVRMLFDEYNTPLGFIEIMKYYDILFDRILEARDNMDVIIVNPYGNIIYPLAPSKLQIQYSKYKESGKNFDNIHFYSSDSQYSDLKVIATIDNHTFFAPIYRRLFYFLAVFLLSVPACYMVARLLSKRISAPLKNIYHKLADKEFNQNLEEIVLPDSHIIEIEKLKNTLNESLTLRHNTMKSMMTLREQEIQAQMLALQSQMNPHFLYNSLNTIGAMAEEGMVAPISEMCHHITYILRYISSDKEQTTTIEEELEHCDLYLKCIHLRHGDSLTYRFDIDDDLLELPVPKLCIQLLVENAIKYTSVFSPPWKLLIKGRKLENSWYIDVIDNGPGFDEEISNRLRKQMDEILSTGLLPSLEINGMGILNIFIRLYLLNGIPFIFDFGNNAEGGAFVRVGGYDEKADD